jgi:hypothetical protein
MTYKSLTSKIGILLSGVYIFVCCVLGYSLVTGDENAIGFGSALILLTAPWSFLLSNVIYNRLGALDHPLFYLMLAASVLVNAIILYVVGLLITKMVRALRGKRTTPQVQDATTSSTS